MKIPPDNYMVRASVGPQSHNFFAPHKDGRDSAGVSPYHSKSHQIGLPLPAYGPAMRGTGEFFF